MPVAVLEVDAQVLDRLVGELVTDPGLELGVDAGRRAVLVEGGDRRRTPLGDRVLGEAVGRDVHGVDGLPPGFARTVPGGTDGVVVGQHRVEAVVERGVEHGAA